MSEANRKPAEDAIVSSEDLEQWHHEDNPQCPKQHGDWQIGPPGYRCTTCGWWCKL